MSERQTCSTRSAASSSTSRTTRSCWAGLPLTGSTLAAIAQNGASWTGGGTLVIWSSLIAVATFCGVSVVDLARKLFLPVVAGLVVSAVVAVIIW